MWCDVVCHSRDPTHTCMLITVSISTYDNGYTVCPVLCCSVQYCPVLCRAVLCSAVLCCAVSGWVGAGWVGSGRVGSGCCVVCCSVPFCSVLLCYFLLCSVLRAPCSVLCSLCLLCSLYSLGSLCSLCCAMRFLRRSTCLAPTLRTFGRVLGVIITSTTATISINAMISTSITIAIEALPEWWTQKDREFEEELRGLKKARRRGDRSVPQWFFRQPIGVVILEGTKGVPRNGGL